MSSLEVFPGIVSDAEILGGEAVIKDTRIPVALILGHLASGMREEEIVYEYDITIEDIRAALAYAALLDDGGLLLDPSGHEIAVCMWLKAHFSIES